MGGEHELKGLGSLGKKTPFYKGGISNRYAHSPHRAVLPLRGRGTTAPAAVLRAYYRSYTRYYRAPARYYLVYEPYYSLSSAALGSTTIGIKSLSRHLSCVLSTCFTCFVVVFALISLGCCGCFCVLCLRWWLLSFQSQS